MDHIYVLRLHEILCTIDVVQVMISVNDHQIMAQWVENRGLS